ncbi:hypothetical protein [Shewanella fidelis]|uniref:Uncharacterized protein n=1 Tax=Shewanella fidelis TaxID=173509 RepID=A0AAW8NKC6_9GAMM|nr:hypothetical protein [Shewanella fidelis]MDR8523718.1 hypothetical protein [Shewanella fidelis]MDW4810265.1 hypothetical protein [Shewanella fidelis]MDW4814410.1 hypothetical protein [Shewanella fidelis]MDW4818501.1 hypothetical protein [Shewanella fidelis]MDW4823847.1 hypothetical protein [Shewanella fidelis]
MKSVIEQDIRILKGGWRVAESEDEIKYVKRLVIALSIEGDPKNGYHLIMTPDGLFTADLHFDSIKEAKEEAEEYFEVSNIQWS